MVQPIQLYVYDLSKGMARILGQQLTGRAIEGIWSVPPSISHHSLTSTVFMLMVPPLGIPPSSSSASRSALDKASISVLPVQPTTAHPIESYRWVIRTCTWTNRLFWSISKACARSIWPKSEFDIGFPFFPVLRIGYMLTVYTA